MIYTVGQYEGKRWAVYCSASRTWYFPARYGKRAATAYAGRLNASAS